MRLYLSSFAMGNHPERLAALAPRGTRASVVVNALDDFPGARQEWLASQSEALERLGFIPEELDLRSYFDSPQRLETDLTCATLLKRRCRSLRSRFRVTCSSAALRRDRLVTISNTPPSQ
jgi:hypothetical protein